MSILNHFGRVKTTYIPYTKKYKHDGIKIYHPGQAISPDGQCIPLTFAYYADNNALTKQIIITLDQQTFKEAHETINYASDGLTGIRRQFILQDFADIIKKITDTFAASIWKTLNISPLLTIQELLWLKVDDMDSHVHHLEKMLMQVMEENKLLQRKIDVLEKSLAKGRLDMIMEENKLLQHRVEALEQKGILYELD